MDSVASPLVKLARQAIDLFVKSGENMKPSKDLVNEIPGQAGTFVSIKKHGRLRGCIGTFEPTCSTIVEEVIQNAISSATKDPRFSPVKENELVDLVITVDVLTHPERVNSPDELDPKRYGVIVKSGWRKGLLLPDLEGVDSVEYQIEICRQKAGIGADEEVELFSFEVKRNK